MNQPSGKGTLVIRPTSGWRLPDVSALWRYRELAWLLTWRRVKGRYRQMALGPLWIVINPLISAVFFSVVFGRIARLPSENVPYALFAYAGLLPWTFFATATSQAATSLVSEMPVLSKVYFPRLVAPVSAIVSAFADFVFSLPVLAFFLVSYGRLPTASVLAVTVCLLMAAVLALGIGLWLAALVVRFRDLKFVVSQSLRMWMYATPIAYSSEIVPAEWLMLYKMNPMYWVVEGFRAAVLGRPLPIDPAMAIPAVLSVLVLITGSLVFCRLERTVVDLL